MSEINNIDNIEKKNTYYINSGKKSSEATTEFSIYMGRTKTLDEIFEQAAKKYQISKDLLKAVGKAESNFDADAVSRCGAQGIMQLMPATAKELGVNDSFDAEQNIMGGAKYLSGLLKKYDGNVKLSLAAYNAGSGNVAKYGGIPPFEETQNYVKKVVNYMNHGINTNGISVAAGNNSNQNQKESSDIAAGSQLAVPASSSTSYIYTSGLNQTTSEIMDLDTAFSYDDYLRFIELLMEKENEDQKEKSQDSKVNYIAKEINYNANVMNLLMDQKLAE